MSSPEADSLDRRLSGIVDMNSQPCELLTAHVAHAARHFVERLPALDGINPADTVYADMEIATRHIIDGLNDDPAGTPVLTTGIATTHLRPHDRHTHSMELELAFELTKTPHHKHRLSLHPHEESYQLTNPGVAHILALTRGGIAVPVMNIRTDRDNPDCSYVTSPNEPGKVDEVYMSAADIKPRREALELMWKLLDDWIKAPVKGQRVLAAEDFKVLGVTQQVNQVLGSPDVLQDRIVGFLVSEINKYEEGFYHKVHKPVEIDGIEYPAVAALDGRKVGNTILNITSALTLDEDPSFGKPPIFPQIRIVPGSRQPIQINDIETGSEVYQSIVRDLYRLISPESETANNKHQVVQKLAQLLQNLLILNQDA